MDFSPLCGHKTGKAQNLLKEKLQRSVPIRRDRLFRYSCRKANIGFNLEARHAGM